MVKEMQLLLMAASSSIYHHQLPFCSSTWVPHNGYWKLKGDMCMGSSHKRGLVLASSSTTRQEVMGVKPKRKVVEHICLLKAKEGLSEEEEKDMLDFLYTTQYQMRGIVAISLGRISERNMENYTHAAYVRFQTKEDLAKFYVNPFYLQVLQDHVTPYCHDLMSVDFESEVEDDILSIFRKGEEFSFGLESILLIRCIESANAKLTEEALAHLEKLAGEFPSLIIQSTQGKNFNSGSCKYTHAVVTRFRSVDDYKKLMGSPTYKNEFMSKLLLMTKDMLCIYYSVDPVF